MHDGAIGRSSIVQAASGGGRGGGTAAASRPPLDREEARAARRAIVLRFVVLATVGCLTGLLYVGLAALAFEVSWAGAVAAIAAGGAAAAALGFLLGRRR